MYELIIMRIPDYPDGYSEGIRTVNRKHPDTLSMIWFYNKVTIQSMIFSMFKDFLSIA